MNPFGNKKRLYRIAIALVALSLGGGLYGALHRSDLRLIGTVDANQILVGSQVTGRIEKLLVEEGQEVKVGDLIAIMEGQELSAAAQSSLAQARSLENQLLAAQSTALSTQGEVSNGVASAKAALDMAQAAHAEAVARRKQQESLTQRTIMLTQKGAMTLQDQDSAQRSLEALEAHERSTAKGVEQAMSALRSAQARSHQGKAARDTAASMEGQWMAAKAQALEAEARQGYTRIYAPVGGRISTVVARIGEVVMAGSPVVAITDFTQTWVYASVPETEADGVKVNDRLSVHMPGGTWVEGRVIAKAVEAAFATQRDASGEKRDIRTIRLKLLIANAEGRFVPGMTTETILPASMRKPS